MKLYRIKKLGEFPGANPPTLHVKITPQVTTPLTRVCKKKKKKPRALSWLGRRIFGLIGDGYQTRDILQVPVQGWGGTGWVSPPRPRFRTRPNLSSTTLIYKYICLALVFALLISSNLILHLNSQSRLLSPSRSYCLALTLSWRMGTRGDLFTQWGILLAYKWQGRGRGREMLLFIII